MPKKDGKTCERMRTETDTKRQADRHEQHIHVPGKDRGTERKNVEKETQTYAKRQINRHGNTTTSTNNTISDIPLRITSWSEHRRKKRSGFLFHSHT